MRSRVGRILAVLPNTPTCDNCASDFNPNHAIGARVQTERVWLCSPACLHRLKLVWLPAVRPTVHRSVVQFVRAMFATNGVN